jgi:hypothetical protein
VHAGSSGWLGATSSLVTTEFGKAEADCVGESAVRAVVGDRGERSKKTELPDTRNSQRQEDKLLPVAGGLSRSLGGVRTVSLPGKIGGGRGGNLRRQHQRLCAHLQINGAALVFLPFFLTWSLPALTQLRVGVTSLGMPFLRTLLHLTPSLISLSVYFIAPRYL